MNYQSIISEIIKLKNPEKIKIFQNFFKTGKGQYGEGDLFLGIAVPIIRGVAKKYIDLSLSDIQVLLENKYHEIRLAGLIILTYQFEKFEKKKNINELKNIFDFYLKNTKYINNWDLVDLSCSKIIGKYLLDKDRSILYKLAISKNLWEKRIAIISTLAFICCNNEHKDTLKICEILIDDKHDLIHKACGWMLREVGKRIDEKILTDFLNKYYKKMPRTMLRYSIERLDESKRMFYLKK